MALASLKFGTLLLRWKKVMRVMRVMVMITSWIRVFCIITIAVTSYHY